MGDIGLDLMDLYDAEKEKARAAIQQAMGGQSAEVLAQRRHQESLAAQAMLAKFMGSAAVTNPYPKGWNSAWGVVSQEDYFKALEARRREQEAAGNVKPRQEPKKPEPPDIDPGGWSD